MEVIVKRLLVIMLIIVAVGVVSAYDAQVCVKNKSNKMLQFSIAPPGGDYSNHTLVPPGSRTYLPGWTGLLYNIKAEVTAFPDWLPTGQYQIKPITLKWGESP